MIDIDKSKLVLVREEDERIVDQPLETKEIGYYRDSWNRFKKNKASLAAFVIICIIMFFILVGPYMKKYTLVQDNPTNAARLGYLTPRIPGIEKLGIFDGTKTISRGKRFLIYMYNSEFGEGIILEGMPQELIDDPNHPDYVDVNQITVKVDYYRYINYITSYMPERYFGILDENEINDTNNDPLGEVRRTLTKEQFEEYMAKNYIIDILAIKESPNLENPDEPYFQYEVRINQFMASLDQRPEDTYFWFGTTSRGGDLFTEIWKGARISLLMAISVLIINSIVGLILGAIAGYYGGILDLIFDRFVEIISSIPFLSVLTLLILRFGSALWVIVLAFTATGWIGSYGTGRMQFYRFKNREYVLAARTLGASDGRIMFKHIFPNTLGLIVTGYALAIPAFVFTEASYSFLGIINYSNAVSVGMLIQQGQGIMQVHPHLLIYPSLYIAILMIAFNLFGNGLRDAFNPSLRGVE
ncbi:MAG: ABC transporter permease [Acholeplasmataceae bacterium]|nr:ABC transporter permease [Acholeplasmataceae bacterium]